MFYVWQGATGDWANYFIEARKLELLPQAIGILARNLTALFPPLAPDRRCSDC